MPSLIPSSRLGKPGREGLVPARGCAGDIIPDADCSECTGGTEPDEFNLVMPTDVVITDGGVEQYRISAGTYNCIQLDPLQGDSVDCYWFSDILLSYPACTPDVGSNRTWFMGVHIAPTSVGSPPRIEAGIITQTSNQHAEGVATWGVGGVFNNLPDYDYSDIDESQVDSLGTSSTTCRRDGAVDNTMSISQATGTWRVYAL